MGDNGVIVQWLNGVWTLVASPVTTTLNAVAIGTDGTAVAVGDVGVLLAMSSSRAWSVVQTPLASPVALRGVWIGSLLSHPYAVVVGDSGTVLVQSSPSAAWTVVNTSTATFSTPLASLALRAVIEVNGQISIFGDGGCVLRLAGLITCPAVTNTVTGAAAAFLHATVDIHGVVWATTVDGAVFSGGSSVCDMQHHAPLSGTSPSALMLRMCALFV